MDSWFVLFSIAIAVCLWVMIRGSVQLCIIGYMIRVHWSCFHFDHAHRPRRVSRALSLRVVELHHLLSVIDFVMIVGVIWSMIVFQCSWFQCATCPFMGLCAHSVSRGVLVRMMMLIVRELPK